MNRLHAVVMLTALSSGWLWGSQPFVAGDSYGSSRNEQAAKRGERETGEDSGSGSVFSGSGGSLKKKSTPEEIAAAVKEACKPLQASDPKAAAEELWQRLKSLECVLTPGYKATDEAKEFLGRLEGLIKNYSSPLGKQKFEAIALEGQASEEMPLILHALKVRGPYDSFYYAVYAILDKDCDARLTSSSASTDVSVTPTAGPSPSSTLSSQPAESMEKKLSPEEIAAAVKVASKPLTAIGPNEAAKELWGRLKQLEQFLTKKKGQDEAKEFLDGLPTMLSKFSVPLGEQKFNAIALDGQAVEERTFIRHVDAAEHTLDGRLDSPYFSFYYAVEKCLKKDLERRESSTASPSAGPSPSSTLSSQPAESMEKKLSPEEIAAAVKAASKPLTAIGPNEEAIELWGRLKDLERVLTPGYSAKEEAKEFLDKLEGLLQNYSSPLGEQKFNTIALEGQASEERTLIKHVDAAERNLAGGFDSPHFHFYREVELILKKDLERRASSAAIPFADASVTLTAVTSRTLSSQPQTRLKRNLLPKKSLQR